MTAGVAASTAVEARGGRQSEGPFPAPLTHCEDTLPVNMMFPGIPEVAADAWGGWNSDVPVCIEGSVGPKCSGHGSLAPSGCGISTAEGSHLYRLFVGCVPPHFSEADLRPLFDQCGDVKDVIVLKDKITGQPKSCAFVSYATQAEAERAIEMLDRKHQLPGASSMMEVRFARSHQYIQAGCGPVDNRQLFFSRVPLQASAEDVREVFGRYGKVDDVSIFTDRKSALSRGCGIITMASRKAAIAAMDGLNEKYPMKGAVTPLSVKWADPELQAKKKKAVEEANADNRMLFFAKILRTAKEDEVKAVFARFGSVHDVNLFRPFQGAPTTKGCGLVTMGSHGEAAAAISGLDGRYSWGGMDSPMVVKWMDAQLQKRRKEDHLAAMRQGLNGNDGPGPKICRVPGTTALVSVPAASIVVPTLSQQGSVRRLDCSHDLPPPGCAPDAIKLFIGNVPKSYTSEHLRPIFSSIGTVVELVIVRDKITDESKGSAFVWYETKQEAEHAIAQLHLHRVLPDPTGEQDRPLVVRRATSKMPISALQVASAAPPMSDSSMDVPAHLQASFVPQTPSNESQIGLTSLSKSQLAVSTLSNDLGSLSLSPNPALGAASESSIILPQAADALYGLTKNSSAAAPFTLQNSEGQLISAATLGIGDDKLDTLGTGVVSNAFASMCAPTNLLSTTNGTQAIHPFPGAGMMPAVLQTTLPSTQTQPVSTSTAGFGQMTLLLKLNHREGAFVSSNLHSIQGSSGALVQLTCGAEGSFVVLMTGNDRQVNAAKSLVQDLAIRAMGTV